MADCTLIVRSAHQGAETGPQTAGGRQPARVSESVAIWPSDGEAQNILRGTILVK